MKHSNTPLMKTRMIKAAFVLSIMACVSAITLAAGGNGYSSAPVMKVEHEIPGTAFTSSANAAEGFYKWIQKNVPCPDFVDTDDDNRVVLWLHINDDGSLRVMNAHANDSRLVDYVRANLEGRIIDSQGTPTDLHFAIRFKKIG